MYFGPASVDGDAERWILRMRGQLQANLAITASVLVLSAVLAVTTVHTWWTLPFVGGLFADLLVVLWCLRRLRSETYIQVAVVSTSAIWVLALVLAPLVPFALPVLMCSIFISLLATVSLLERHEIPKFIAVGAAVMTVVTALASTTDSPIDRQLPETLRDIIVMVGVAVFMVPLAFLAWDSHVRHAVAISRMVDANSALRSSRARLVGVADEERRRLERNLHDGAQQRLVGLAMRLRLLATHHPEAAAEVDTLVDEVQGALEELRELAHGLYPPLLERRGLPEALSVAGRRSPVTVRVQAGGIGRYRQAIETAVYFCCLEGLQNASKYAGADVTVTISLDERGEGLDRRLLLSIVDDGVGFDPAAARAGRGLNNMADRMAAVDAELEVKASPGGGVALTATIPLGGAGTPEREHLLSPSTRCPAPSTFAVDGGRSTP